MQGAGKREGGREGGAGVRETDITGEAFSPRRRWRRTGEDSASYSFLLFVFVFQKVVPVFLKVSVLPFCFGLKVGEVMPSRMQWNEKRRFPPVLLRDEKRRGHSV